MYQLRKLLYFSLVACQKIIYTWPDEKEDMITCKLCKESKTNQSGISNQEKYVTCGCPVTETVYWEVTCNRQACYRKPTAANLQQHHTQCSLCLAGASGIWTYLVWRLPRAQFLPEEPADQRDSHCHPVQLPHLARPRDTLIRQGSARLPKVRQALIESSG